MKGKRYSLLIYGVAFIAILLTALNELDITYLDPVVTASIRWVAILSVGYLVWKRKSLTTWILFSMVIGAEFGHDFPVIASEFKVVSKIFLKLIKTIIAPLIFGTLVVGIAGHANLKQVGRMGWKSILYFEIATTIALLIGLFAINISKAGMGITLPPHTDTTSLTVPPPSGWEEIVLHIFPENIAKSIAEGQVLQIVVFSILFALGLALVKEPHKQTMLRFCESLTEVMFKFTGIVMYFAPFAVGAAIAYTVGHMGIGILGNLFKLLATLYVALIVFILVVFVPVALIIKLPIKRFIKAVLEPATIAFSTTSSEAALPKALENMEKFGVPRKIVAFVLPAGYSFNLDGSTLYLSLAAVFVAQAAGVHMSFGQQILMLLTLMLTTKGIAGVPRASLVILMGTVTSFHLPMEPVFLILGIDELMDMARTSVNLIGNCLASTVIAKWEGEETYNDPSNREFT
jgi:proton glutamate symport protein